MAATPLDWAINLLILQGLLGAFDALYHHELTGFGNNPQPPGRDLADYAEALLAVAEAGSAIFVLCGPL